MPNKQALTERQIDEVVRLYVQQRRPSNRIARQFGVAPSTITRYLRMRGVPYMVNRHTPDEHDAETIDFLYWGFGMSTFDIARRMGVSQKCIHRRMVKYGIPRRPQRGRGEKAA